MQRNKRRKAARISGNGVSKKYGSSSIGKKERRISDTNHEEEEMSGIEGAVHEHRKNNENAHRGEEVPPSGSTRLMPPPSSFQPRKHFTNGGKSLLTARNADNMTHPHSHNADASIDGLSFSSSSVVTSTPKPLPGLDANSGSRHSNALLVTGHDTGDATKNARPSVLPTAPGPVKTERTTHAPWFSKTSSTSVSPDHNARPNPLPTPLERVPTLESTQSITMPVPKSNGPRPLGMRRTINGQAPSLSQGLSRARSSETNLPVKQSGFKVPFAKQKPAVTSVPTGAERRPQSSLASDSNSTNGTHDRLSSRPHVAPSDCGQKDVSATAEKPPQVRPPSSCSMSEQKDTKTVGDVKDRSSSPPADADSSFDFDMNFDPDELEKACRAYD